ncbi:MAG: hypothetical protein NC548_35540 [Lachnospiraceae bacterium]|nr:hypothetical protein [Lachnospiraceae bacterium]MCM1232716.1 hypothetical protein [Ruminococcus flavefaciens]
MSEEIKERLSKTEYDKVGEMLLELINDCPHIPKDLQGKAGGIQYQSMGADKCIGILTLPGAKYIHKNVLGGFTAQLSFQIAYKSNPTNNRGRIDAQAVVDNIMDWLEDVTHLPSLSGGRTITKITASSSFATVSEVEGDSSTIFVADAVMEYEVD